MPKNLYTNQLADSDFPRGQAGLNAAINRNYNIAIAYYAQRESAFEHVMAGKAGEFKARYQQIVQKATNTWLSAIKTDFYKLLNAAGSGKQVYEKNMSKAWKSEDGKYRASLNDLVQEFLSTDSSGKITKKKAGWGVMLEEWLRQQLSGPNWLEAINDYKDYVVNDALEMVMHGYGTKTQASAMTKNIKRETRTDTYIGKKTPDQVGQMELTAWLDFANIDDKLTQAQVTQSLINAVSQMNIDTSIYGFQVKAYINGSDSLRWSNAQVIIDQLNKIYEAGDRWSQNKSWSSNYAAMYPFYYLSKYILNIVNPINIGVITPKGLEYMSDFLMKYHFYCEVSLGQSTGDTAEDYRGGGVEVLGPKAVGKQILTRQVTGSTMSLQGTALAAQGQGKWGLAELENVEVANVRYS